MSRNKWLEALALVILLAGVISGCGGTAGQSGSASIQVRDPWVRAVMMGGGMESQPGQMTPSAQMGGMPAAGMGNGAAYMVLVNNGSTGDRLLRAESDIAQAVELHVSEMKNDVMTMRPVEAVDLPVGGQAELKPGGYHIMLVGLTRELKPGDKVSLTLVFEKAGPLIVEAEVKNP